MSIQAYDINLPAGGTQTIEASAQICDFLSSGSAFDQIEVRPNFTQGAATLKLGQGFDFGSIVERWLIVNKGATAIAGQVMLSTAGFRNFRISGDVNVLDNGMSRTLTNQTFLAQGFRAADTSNRCHVQLWNPVGSGKVLIVESINAVSTSGQWLTNVGFANAILPTPTDITASSIGSKLAGGVLGVAKVYNCMSAGGQVGVALAALAGQAALPSSQNFKEPVVVPPGWGLIQSCVQINTALQAGFEWYEQAQ
ncbi:hypothetical protein E2553_43215 [Paraburkholderia dipogonis]|uniref:Uncharacterized protein n=1 Tax=Paraburkholderia dipogonis TaxID=1211383 RepID=A0A4Y8MGG2_9BURK|nr:hypothetical protein [Paraburkholderia dipogonis]TFE36541.1 hypothetical protein E2553_43215 [Paraburkholderia dipogonis]